MFYYLQLSQLIFVAKQIGQLRPMRPALVASCAPCFRSSIGLELTDLDDRSQLLTYITALSGGNWMLGSWATSNAPTFQALNRDVWKLSDPLVLPEPDQPAVYADAVARTTAKQQHVVVLMLEIQGEYVGKWIRLIGRVLLRRQPVSVASLQPGHDTSA